MNLIELIEQNTEYTIIGLAVLSLLLLIIVIVLMIKQRILSKKYQKFMKGAKGKNLEETILKRFTEIDNLINDNISIHNKIDKINESLLTTIQKIGIVKYDAFMEMGGKLSFVLALLDQNNDGFILNSVHSSREGCYTYLKEIIKGESFLELSSDERSALDQAINYNTFME